MVTARAASQRKPHLSDLPKGSYSLQWKRHGDADDAGAERGRNFCTASLSRCADHTGTERSSLAPTRDREQTSRQRHGHTDECAKASSGWRRLQSVLCCRLRQHTNTTDACALQPYDRNYPSRSTSGAATSQVTVADACSLTSPGPEPARSYRGSIPPLPAVQGRHPLPREGARHHPAALRTLGGKRFFRTKILFGNKTLQGSPVERKNWKKMNGVIRKSSSKPNCRLHPHRNSEAQTTLASHILSSQKQRAATRGRVLRVSRAR
jgi:hypothetical protein